ncbi:peptidyl-prolyl cis-trans isomerase cyp11-like [Cimex lectularius]|uniref:PPIase cyclophilin-type domain-containing protein n=1 Tax=Cimex lectularius TaxID=79782 RepID=A0A8I6RNX7_CIMLE|nr:peptidyl-prolyl cis-trans isomerase cyp11-like [Cimex lectularius]
MNRQKISMNFDGKRNLEQRKVYKEHLLRIKNPQSKINNSAPPLPVAFYYDAGNLDNDTRRIDEIDSKNMNLLKHINTIYRTIGKVDSSFPTLLRSTNFYGRVHNNKKIEKENKLFYNLLMNKGTYYSRKELEKDYARNLENVVFASRHPEFYNEEYFLLPLERWDIINPAITKPNLLPHGEPKRVRCLFHIGIEDKMGLRKLGKLLIEVYRDWAPKQGDHFLNLVRGFNGKSYVGSPFHRIQKGFACVSGDVTKKTGLGVYSIYDECYPNENNYLQFNGPGVVSSFSLKPGHNHSQFMISFRKLEICNKEFTVFGRVVLSLGTLSSIEEYGTASGAPTKKIVITKCSIMKSNTNFLDNTLEKYPKLNLGRRLTKRMKEDIEKFALKSECGCPLYRAISDSSDEYMDLYAVNEQGSHDAIKRQQPSMDGLRMEKQSIDTLITEKRSIETLRAEKRSIDTMLSEKRSTDTVKSEKHSIDTVKSEKRSLDAIKPKKHSVDTMKIEKHSNDTMDHISNEFKRNKSSLQKFSSERILTKQPTQESIQNGKRKKEHIYWNK